TCRPQSRRVLFIPFLAATAAAEPSRMSEQQRQSNDVRNTAPVPLRHPAAVWCPYVTAMTSPPPFAPPVGVVQATEIGGTTFFRPLFFPPPLPPVMPPPCHLMRPPATPMTSSPSRCTSPAASSTTSAVSSSTDARLRALSAGLEAVFSRRRLSRNSYLRRKMAGARFVSVRFLAQLNAVKRQLASFGGGDNSPPHDQLIVAAARLSAKLELNDAATKIRSLNDDNDDDEGHDVTLASHTMLLIDVDQRLATIQALVAAFSSSRFGPVLDVRVVPADRPLPPHLRGYAPVVPQLGKVNFLALYLSCFLKKEKKLSWAGLEPATVGETGFVSVLNL
ncbi:MAG: hypothetical protein AAFP26_13990, partial [Planctomycetota bacterium]